MNRNAAEVIGCEARERLTGVTGDPERRQQQLEALVAADPLSVGEALQLSEHARVQPLQAHRLRPTDGHRQTQPEERHDTALPAQTPEHA